MRVHTLREMDFCGHWRVDFWYLKMKPSAHIFVQWALFLEIWAISSQISSISSKNAVSSIDSHCKYLRYEKFDPFIRLKWRQIFNHFLTLSLIVYNFLKNQYFLTNHSLILSSYFYNFSSLFSYLKYLQCDSQFSSNSSRVVGTLNYSSQVKLLGPTRTTRMKSIYSNEAELLEWSRIPRIKSNYLNEIELPE